MTKFALSRRAVLGSAIAGGVLPRRSARAQGPVLRLGVMTDLSGPYSSATGINCVHCTRQAVQEFTASRPMNVEIVIADHQNKADIGAGIARQWCDQGGVDAFVDVPSSAVALAVNGIVREKNKILLNSGAATADLTGKQCSPNTVAWTFDNYMLAKSTGPAVVKAGGDRWFFVTANYVFGHQLQADTTRFVEQAGGKVLGSRVYPFPETTDFSAILVQAQASGANVLGLANSGADSINCIKQAREFGLTKTMRIAALALWNSDMHAVGLDVAQGLVLTETYYWNLNDRTRAFMDRIKPKTPDLWPNAIQAGCYGATLHYLKTVADMGVAAAKADGAATMARMKAMPTDDDCFGPGRIREDGRKLTPAYLFQVKSPAESTGPWDTSKVIATTPGDQAFRPLSEGGCPLVHG
jgi:branched-chain amino acid transport system substrate-binding protein